MKTEDMVKLALTACLSIIVTGASAWLVFGQDKVTRAEVDASINRALLSERRELELRIESNSATAQRLESSITALVQAQQEVVVEQRVLIERVNTLVDRLDTDR